MFRVFFHHFISFKDELSSARRISYTLGLLLEQFVYSFAARKLAYSPASRRPLHSHHILTGGSLVNRNLLLSGNVKSYS